LQAQSGWGYRKNWEFNCLEKTNFMPQNLTQRQLLHSEVCLLHLSGIPTLKSQAFQKGGNTHELFLNLPSICYGNSIDDIWPRFGDLGTQTSTPFRSRPFFVYLSNTQRALTDESDSQPKYSVFHNSNFVKDF